MIKTTFRGKRYRYVEIPVFNDSYTTGSPLSRCRQCVCCSDKGAYSVLTTDDDLELHNHLSALAPKSPINNNNCYMGTWIRDIKPERLRMAMFILEHS